MDYFTYKHIDVLFRQISSSTRKKMNKKTVLRSNNITSFPCLSDPNIWGITYFHLELSITSLNSYFKVKIITLFHF